MPLPERVSKERVLRILDMRIAHIRSRLALTVASDALSAKVSIREYELCSQLAARAAALELVRGDIQRLQE